MKIQCSCGAKYAFDISPEMAQNPVRFVCAACGVDASDMVNSLIRQQLGLPAADAAPAPVPVALHDFAREVHEDRALVNLDHAVLKACSDSKLRGLHAQDQVW